DVGPGDLTSELVIPENASGHARIEAREALVLAGLPMLEEVFRLVDPTLECRIEQLEGRLVAPNTPLVRLHGPMHSILRGERTSLNVLARLCGIATLARQYVEAVAGTGVEVVDTRKTIPGWRHLDKYAVAVGGAGNHRIGLFDGILIKDNHIAAAGGVKSAVEAALAGAPPGIRVQVEVQREEEALAACEAGADFLLLDNCSVEAIRAHVERFGDRALLEASGGITLENIRAYAETGVHRISVGALTHAALASDVALEVEDEDLRK
ncbi:MAG: carboxylating nicotinate-nucleotide diphosphorylase, partial [Myxococcota bacterium]